MYNDINSPAKSAGRSFFSYIIVIILGFLAGWQVNAAGFFASEVEEPLVEPPAELEISDQVDLGLFWLVWEEVDTKYVDIDKVDYQEMVYGAIQGMVNALDDPYTVFMTPEQSQEFRDSLEGKLEGIGAELTVEEQSLVIVSPLRDSPAEKAGLLPGDVIYEIDGEPTFDMTLFEAIMNIRGEKGTTVTLTIIREDVEDPFEVSIVRDSIDLDSVTFEMEGEIAYISVNQFNDKTLEQFRQAISQIILDEPEGMLVDLRFNGGGFLDTAVDLLGFVLPEGDLAVDIKERGKEDRRMKVAGGTKVLDLPLVVLVNEGSASASEIVAGAIQDHKRGVIMGTQTFGKGSVQEVEQFSDGSSMRITIARWFTPDGRSIDQVGLTPDILVEITDEDIEEQYDRQKEEALEYLRGL